MAATDHGNQKSRFSVLTAPVNTKERKVDVPRDVVRITSTAYHGNTLIQRIYIPGSVQVIDPEAFMRCTDLVEVRFAVGMQLRTIPESCFTGCESLATIRLPESLAIIGDYAFVGCRSLANLVVPDSVIDVGVHTFDGWSESQVIRIKRRPALSDDCHATMICDEVAVDPDVEIPKPHSEGTLRYYAVRCQCGHVGRGKYIEITYAVYATSGKEAAKEARNIPRVKHHLPLAILGVDEIGYEQYLEIKEKNRFDPYLNSHNVQQQRRHGDAINSRITSEPVKHTPQSDGVSVKKVYVRKTKVLKPKKYLKSHEM